MFKKIIGDLGADCSKCILLSLFVSILFTLAAKFSNKPLFEPLSRGRLLHGRHFTFKSIITDSAITLVSRDVTGTSVDENCPYAACGTWLQVLCEAYFIVRFSFFRSNLVVRCFVYEVNE